MRQRFFILALAAVLAGPATAGPAAAQSPAPPLPPDATDAKKPRVVPGFDPTALDRIVAALRRLLPVRLRRLARAEPGARGPRALRALRRAGRAQPDDAARHPGEGVGARRPSGARSTSGSATTTRRCMDEAGIEAKGAGRPQARCSTASPPSRPRSRAGRRGRPPAQLGRARAVRLRLAAGLQGRRRSTSRPGPGRPGPARPRLLPEGRAALRGRAQAVPAHVQKMFELLGDAPEAAAAGRPDGAGDRDRAGQGVPRARQAARPRERLPQDRRQAELAALAPAFAWNALLRRHRRARRSPSSTSTWPDFFKGAGRQLVEPAEPADDWKTYLRWHAAARRGAAAARRLRQRELRLLRQDADRGQGAAAALEALRRAGRRRSSARRWASATWRRPSARRARQRMAEDGGRARDGAARGHPRRCPG